MEYITGIEQYAGIEKTALTLGKFDGLHKGHQKLIDKICAYSGVVNDKAGEAESS